MLQKIQELKGKKEFMIVKKNKDLKTKVENKGLKEKNIDCVPVGWKK